MNRGSATSCFVTQHHCPFVLLKDMFRIGQMIQRVHSYANIFVSILTTKVPYCDSVSGGWIYLTDNGVVTSVSGTIL